jgi:hypothetical protein
MKRTSKHVFNVYSSIFAGYGRTLILDQMPHVSNMSLFAQCG